MISHTYTRLLSGVGCVFLGFVHPRLHPPEPDHGAQRTDLSDRESHGAAQSSGLHGAGPPQENRRQHLQQTGLENSQTACVR